MIHGSDGVTKKKKIYIYLISLSRIFRALSCAWGYPKKPYKTFTDQLVKNKNRFGLKNGYTLLNAIAEINLIFNSL